MSAKYKLTVYVTSHGATAEEIVDDVSRKLDDLSVNAHVDRVDL